MANKETKVEETKATTKKPRPAKKNNDINTLREEVARLKERLLAKDKEVMVIEDELNDKCDHLQFMLNAITGDKERLTNEVAELKFKNERLERENEYLLDKVNATRYSFAQRMRILFTGKM